MQLGFCKHCVIRKKTKVRFGTATHCTEEILDIFTQMYEDLQRRHLLEVITTLCVFSLGCWVFNMKHKGEVLELFVEWKKNMEKST